MDVKNRRVVVMGLGCHAGGVAAVRFLSALGAKITITDTADEQALRASLEQLDRCRHLTLRLGEHCEADFRQADLVVVNPAVPPSSPYLQVAREAGATITTEIDLFLQSCPAPVIGVTGTNGKSTTAAMIAAILRRDGLGRGGRRCHLGGNNGVSLLADLDNISSSDWVVLELSSFHLARLREETLGVQVAVVTGCTPNHLGWHGSFENYVAEKQRLLTMQTCQSIAVLNDLDDVVAAWSTRVQGKQEPLVASDAVPSLTVPGQHNRVNARLAMTAARAIGCRAVSVHEALANFSGLPDRLELVAEFSGQCFINDSQATTPEAVIAALKALRQPIWLLAGGYDQGLDLERLSRAIVEHARGACLFGAVGERMAHAVRRLDGAFMVQRVTTLSEAFVWCLDRSRSGECLLLSPACASFDQFDDCQERAARFAQLVHSLESGQEQTKRYSDRRKRLVTGSSPR